MKRGLLTLAGALVFTTASAAGCGSDSLVGGECGAGFAQCGLRCVDLTTDTKNCGACGNACAPGVSCVAGTCGGGHVFEVDAAVGDATAQDAQQANDGGDANVDATPEASSDGEVEANDASSFQSDSSAGMDSGALDGADFDAACNAEPPYDQHDRCGGCTTACTTNEVCKPVAPEAWACANACDAPLLACNGRCVDTESDPDNCGICGRFCASHLCSAGVCEGSTPGDIVLVGHDYATTPVGTAQGKAFANAVFIPGANPLRVMTYERYADPTAVSAAKAILAARGAQLGRALSYTVAAADGYVTSSLGTAAFDVLIVFDQKSAPPGALATLGASWSNAITTFAKAGGVVVALDGATGTGEMPALVTSAGMFDVSAHAPLAAGSAVTVSAPSDVVGLGVLSPYGVWDHSARFTTASTATAVVRAADASNEPVVLHRVAN